MRFQTALFNFSLFHRRICRLVKDVFVSATFLASYGGSLCCFCAVEENSIRSRNATEVQTLVSRTAADVCTFTALVFNMLKPCSFPLVNAFFLPDDHHRRHFTFRSLHYRWLPLGSSPKKKNWRKIRNLVIVKFSQNFSQSIKVYNWMVLIFLDYLLSLSLSLLPVSSTFLFWLLFPFLVVHAFCQTF